MFVSLRLVAWVEGLIGVFKPSNGKRASSFLAQFFLHSGPWLSALAIAAVYYAASLPQPVVFVAVLYGFCPAVMLVFAAAAIAYVPQRHTRDASGFLLPGTIEEWRSAYRPGTTVTQFIAYDIRRDVEVVDVSKMNDGIITARTRTWNVLYHFSKIQPQPDFGPVREIEIERLWDWSGELWGGPVPPNSDAA
jgi:hypothetical protein